MTNSPEPGHRLQNWVHRTLLLGVSASGVLLTLGLAFVYLHHEIRPEGPPPTLPDIVREAWSGSGVSIILLGLLLLMVTPLLRVAVLAVGWTMVGNRRFALVAIGVFCLLGLSIVLGIG